MSHCRYIYPICGRDKEDPPNLRPLILKTVQNVYRTKRERQPEDFDDFECTAELSYKILRASPSPVLRDCLQKKRTNLSTAMIAEFRPVIVWARSHILENFKAFYERVGKASSFRDFHSAPGDFEDMTSITNCRGRVSKPDMWGDGSSVPARLRLSRFLRSSSTAPTARRRGAATNFRGASDGRQPRNWQLWARPGLRAYTDRNFSVRWNAGATMIIGWTHSPKHVVRRTAGRRKLAEI
ncbi:hypothetical protein B0H17DRAFT_1258982 [Mycena rosella]|uniref:Uncharacterized protein n=1 Tax=Mycena rosella TaxID=1033263 RepID=A0AAD7DSA0_MYCRO|nr:hypothetical protein B0H17DRAFT_1258982 [Mycena rosella]